MNYQLQYNYCAIIIYVIILVSYLLKKRTKETHNKVFTIIVIVSMIGAIVNVFNTAGNMKTLPMPHSLLVFLDYVYFIALNLSPFIYAIYAITLTRKNLRTLNIKGKIMIFAPVTFIWFMLITNPYSHMVFQYVDGVYTRGSSQFIMYVIDLYYVAGGVLYVLREKDSTTLDLKISLAMFFIIGCTMAAIQYVKPEMLVQHLGLSVCELIVLINLQKPEEYLDSQTGAYNRNAFEWIFNMNINAKQNMSILMINIEDMNFLIQTVGLDVEKILIKEIANFLWDVSKGDLYIIDSKSMFIVKDTSDDAVIDEIINKIEKRFDNKWGDLENKIFINYKMMKVRVPEDVSDLDVFYFCHSNFIGLAPTNGNMVEIKNIDFNKAGRRIKVEKIIKRAINEDNFTMYYQPIYSFRDKRIVSAEALIRLFDPEEGFIPPDEFIPIAERNGTIIKIGEIVFEKVFAFIRDNDIEELGIKYIEINLSVIQCMQEELASKVLDLLEKYGVKKDFINLEITETAAFDSPKVLLKNMEKLFEAGISFSLDDFGTGYSNINSLMSLPIDIIKLDKTLIDMASNHERGKGVIDSSVAMAKKMGLEIVAEGIEEQHQIGMLKNMGIDYLQGYFFSRPLPGKDFIDFISNQQSSY